MSSAASNSSIGKLLAAFALGVSAMSASAGMRGINVVFVNIGTSDIYASNFYQSFSDSDFEESPQLDRCWGNATGGLGPDRAIEFIARTKRPEGMDVDLARKIWDGDTASIAKARKILQRKYTSGAVSFDSGLDGLYIFEWNGHDLSMMSVGTYSGVSKKSTFTTDLAHPKRTATNFSLAICNVSHPVMKGLKE